MEEMAQDQGEKCCGVWGEGRRAGGLARERDTTVKHWKKTKAGAACGDEQ